MPCSAFFAFCRPIFPLFAIEFIKLYKILSRLGIFPFFIRTFEKLYLQVTFMKKIFFIALLCFFGVFGGVAQNHKQVKNYFQAGNYVEAKPLCKKLLKNYPKHAEYNYWYAISCIKTDDPADVKPMLEIAASSKKYVDADRYLGDIYYKEKRYDKVVEHYEKYIKNSGDKSVRSIVEDKLKFSEKQYALIRTAEQVCFIDSFVIDKSELLSVYRMGKDVGRLATCAQYFNNSSMPGHIYETERGMDIYFSDNNAGQDSLLKLYQRSMAGGEWDDVRPLEGFDTNGNDNYPFMLSNGVTLYFASDGEGSMGGYDIFRSNMNTETGQFYPPFNLGMPYNSEANDYMMAINEVANIGWMASDRNQPEGKVCVYVFIPNKGQKRINVDKVGYKKAYSMANLLSIASTQQDNSEVQDARQRMSMLFFSNDALPGRSDFFFVIDDLNDYNTLDDFKSDLARELYVKFEMLSETHANDLKQLQKYRDEYVLADDYDKRGLRDDILLLESKVENETVELEKMKYEIRRLEQKELYGTDDL